MSLWEAVFQIITGGVIFWATIRAINFLADATTARLHEGFERKMRELDQARMPVDDMVDVVSEPPEWERECMEREYAHRNHADDCACKYCWPNRMGELVAGFDWDAAEDDLLRRRP